ncbi:DUF3159 domain-containing protein [Nocardiopsis mangrovi]|uniref:DUF3159 domain-containing protein n=1 Tax=Nocardiopsis mangrovi TaxID=1179818 RepID=A0ABV9DYG1_9ACTN
MTEPDLSDRPATTAHAHRDGERTPTGPGRTTDRTDEGPVGPEDEGAGNGADDPARPEQPVDVRQAVIDGIGGPSGMVYTALPVVGFSAAVPFVPLPAAVGVAIAAALALAGFRMWRGEQLMPALGGVFGVAVAGGVAAWTGSANDFFLIGIWAALAAGIATLVTVIVRRPLTGVVWNAFHGGGHAWREDKPSLLAHDIATLTVVAMFGARFAVRQWLYLADSTTGLAIADTVTGFPLAALAAVVVIWAFRRSTKRLTTNTDAQARPGH